MIVDVMDQRSDERKGEARSGGSSDAESFDPKVDVRIDAKIDYRVDAASDSAGDSVPGPDFDPMTDPMAPPREPCECWCMHCERTFMSNEMWFQRVVGAKDSFPGFWMCPTPNCSGAGFSFDIFPTDPNHPSNEGWHFCEEDDYDEEEFEEEEIEALIEGDAADRDKEWDAEEPRYKELDELAGEDDDISGEEWKYGLEPGAQRPGSWSDAARAEWEEEQRKYDQPDERPRVLDWSNMPERGGGDSINEDDIPF